MHCSWFISEILTMIFLKASDKHTLSTLARTCKLFREPALDLLWSRQKSLVPLLKTMPSDLWGGTNPGMLQHFCRPLTSSDFDSWNNYAHRITFLQFSYFDVDIGILEALSQYMQSTPLLPNLRTFRAYGLYKQPLTYPILDLFLGPKTEMIAISVFNLSEPTLEVISSIKNRCPSVRSLYFGYPATLRGVQVVSDLLCEFAELECLTVNGLTPRALSHIAKYSTLRRATLNGLQAKDVGSITECGFTGIRELGLTTYEDAGTFNCFLSLIRPEQLRELSLGLKTLPASPAQWDQCFRTLSQYCSSTLTALSIRDDHLITSQEISNRVIGPGFEYLLPFQQLTNISFFCGPYDLDDDGLKRMALAWPHLQVLVLQTVCGISVDASRVTLGGLVSLLEHCPKLTTLDIAIDARDVGLRPSKISNHNIVTLTVGNSIIEDSVAVSAFLCDILPNLEQVFSWEDLRRIDHTVDDEDDENIIHVVKQYQFRWDEVSYWIESFGAKHRRKRA